MFGFVYSYFYVCVGGEGREEYAEEADGQFWTFWA